MKKHIVAFVAMFAFLASFISSSAQAGVGPAPVQMEGSLVDFGVSWVKHDPGSKIVDVYGYSARAGAVGVDDSCRLRATDNGIANSWAFDWMVGIGRTVTDEYGVTVCPSGSFCAGKVFGVNDVGDLTYCNIAGDGLTASACAMTPTFKANIGLSIGASKLIASDYSNNQVYSVDYITGTSLPLTNCSAALKMTTVAGLPANGLMYLLSDRAGTVGGIDLWRINWTGTDCTLGTDKNLNSLAFYGNANTVVNDGPGAVDPLTGDMYYTKNSGIAFRMKLSPICGDGFISGLDEIGGEECDGAAAVPLNGQTCIGLGYTGGTLGCNGSCKFDKSLCTSPAVCGNTIKEAGEACDTPDFGGATCASIKGAGWTGSLACTGSCTTIDSSACSPPAPFCGDTVCNGAENCSTCPSDCGVCCGNSVINAGEDCDGATLGGATCSSVLGSGYSGSLSCKVTCKFNTASCTAPVTCGNSVLDVGEQCDGTKFGSHTCVTEKGEGYTGSLTCTGMCVIDNSGCTPPNWGVKVVSGGCKIVGADPLNAAIQTVNGLCQFSFIAKNGLTANDFTVAAKSVKLIPYLVAQLPNKSAFTVPQGVVWSEADSKGNMKQFGFGAGIYAGDEGTGYAFDALTDYPVVHFDDIDKKICFGRDTYENRMTEIDVGNGVGCLAAGYHVDINVETKTVVKAPWKDGAGGDGGADAGDAGVGGDAGPTGPGPADGGGGGCSCAVPGQEGFPLSGSAILALALIISSRRRARSAS